MQAFHGILRNCEKPPQGEHKPVLDPGHQKEGSAERFPVFPNCQGLFCFIY